MDLHIDGFPGPLTAEPSGDEAWRYADGQLTGVAGPDTDMFVDPITGSVTVNAPRLLGTAPVGDFTFQARVDVDFETTFDAGVLLLWGDERTWGKLCFEFSPQGEPMVVTVITRGISDDANAFVVNGNTVWLRVSRVGAAFAFHASTNGQFWQFVRHFRLEAAGSDLRMGFESQSPTGSGGTARFSEVVCRSHTLTDLRDGS